MGDGGLSDRSLSRWLENRLLLLPMHRFGRAPARAIEPQFEFRHLDAGVRLAAARRPPASGTRRDHRDPEPSRHSDYIFPHIFRLALSNAKTLGEQKTNMILSPHGQMPGDFLRPRP